MLLEDHDPVTPPEPGPPPMPHYAWTETIPALIIWAVIVGAAIWSAVA